MAEYENEDNCVKIWKNDKKTDEAHADMSGLAVVNGVEYYADAYINKGQKGNWLKIKLKPKQPRTDAQSPAQPAGDKADDFLN